MNYSIRISEADWVEVHKALFTPDGCENAGILLCGTARSYSDHSLIVRRFIPVPLEHYIVREPYHLEVAPAFYNDIISISLREKLSPVLIHSHPNHTEAWYSKSDDYGESRLLAVFEALLPGVTPASLVITPASATGRRFENEEFVGLAGIGVYGYRSRYESFSLTAKPNKNVEAHSPQFDRQIRAFGQVGQDILQRLKVAVVGVGGIGSLVAEQLARAGVRDFILMDFDDIEASNVSRQFGATITNVGRPKVDVAAESIRTFGADEIRTIRDSAIRQKVLLELRDRDVVFSCVDNDRTRAFLNRFAYQYVVPVIDHGTRLDGRGGQITAAAGRVTLVGHGMACLRCSHHLNPDRIRAEDTPKDQREALQLEGYIIGIDEPAPAIVSLNTVIAGLGVTAAFNMFLNVTGGTQPVDQIYDATSGTVFPVEARHEVSCDVCSNIAGSKGLGDLKIVSAYD